MNENVKQMKAIYIQKQSLELVDEGVRVCMKSRAVEEEEMGWFGGWHVMWEMEGRKRW